MKRRAHNFNMLHAFLLGACSGVCAALFLYIPFYKLFPGHHDLFDRLSYWLCPFIVLGISYWPYPRWTLDLYIIGLNALAYATALCAATAIAMLAHWIFRKLNTRNIGVKS